MNNVVLIFTMCVSVSCLALSWKSIPKDIRQECFGCHTSERMQNLGKYANGFGQWTDLQCFGCHIEINEIATRINRGKKDRRSYSIPISRPRLIELAKHGLPYMSAPEELSWEHYETYRIRLFLARPVTIDGSLGRKAPLMPAFPELHIETSEINKFEPSDTKRGKILFVEKCFSCHHEKAKRTQLALSIFKWEWLRNYSRGVGVQEGRTMPNIELTEQDAKDVHAYLGSYLHEQIRLVDLAVGNLVPSTIDSTPLPDQTIVYIWQGFFRDGDCVHCHGIEGRARNRFDISEKGFQVWLQENDPWELWRRLEIREIEATFGVGSEVPGMPMSGAPLPKPLRDVISRWIGQGCVDPKGKKWCTRQEKDKK